MRHLNKNNHSKTKTPAPKAAKPIDHQDAVKVKVVSSTNGDTQFSSTGSALIDLVSKGADSFIDKGKKDTVSRYVKMVKAAFNSSPILTQKIGRYFRDRENGQGLKEQPTLMLAILDGQLEVDEILNVLMVHASPDTPGAQELSRIDFLDLVRILAWHKYLNGKDSKLSFNMCKAMAIVIASNKNALEQVLRYKSKEIAYDTSNKVQVSIIDIIGIIRNMKDPLLNVEIAAEYNAHLYPRYRGQNYGVSPVTQMAKEHRAYFKGDYTKNEVPKGITFEKVLAKNDKNEIRYMAINKRLSATQFKLNLSVLESVLTAKEIETLRDHYKLNLFPHEILAMGKAFTHGTQYTSKSAGNLKIVDSLLVSTINRYAEQCKKNVLVLGDTSGSMNVLLSPKSTITNSEFSCFMSYIAAHVSGTGIFGIWDNKAKLYESKAPSFSDYHSNIAYSNASTDVHQSIIDVANYYVGVKKDAPDVICLISDMQFNSTGVDTSAIAEAYKAYKKITGKNLELIFWNVSAKTSPTVVQDGVMMISGFSAANCDIIFGIVNDSSNKPNDKIKPEDLIKHINETYK